MKLSKSSFKTFYQKYGPWIELAIALILDAILIMGHIFSIALPHANVTTILNDPIFGLIAATLVQFFIGRKFYILMFKEMFKWHRLGMNTLIGLSSLSAYIWSLYAFIINAIQNNLSSHGQFMYFFEIGTSIITFLLIGDAISNYLKTKVNQDMKKVLEIQVPTALQYDIQTKRTTEVATRSLMVDDYVLIQPQTRVPSDAKIVQHFSYFDESLITGESNQIFHDIGHEIIGGTTNITNTVVAQITKPVNRTIVASIIKRIKKLQSAKPEIQKVADKIAMWFVPIVLVLAIVSFLLHFFLGFEIQQTLGLHNLAIPQFVDPSLPDAVYNNVKVAIYFSITLIAISCPCALGLATPLAIVVGVGKAGRQGIVFNNVDVFEKTKKINLVAFDKTGTLTQNQMVIHQVFGDPKNLNIVYSLAKHSHHPLSKKIWQHLSNQNLDVITFDSFEELPGIGLLAHHNDMTYRLASYNYFIKNGYKVVADINQDVVSKNTNVCFAINNTVVSAFVIADTIRENASMVIEMLQKSGIKTCIISGDNSAIVKQVAVELGVDYYFGDCSAFDKERIVGDFQDQGYQVGFAGDGINDLIALKKADLSINMSLVNESANNISDLSVIDQNIINVYTAIEIAKKTNRLILCNFLWAFVYNIVAIPLAFIGFVPAILAVALMGFSDFAVVLNTLLFGAIQFRSRTKKMAGKRKEVK